MHYANHKYTCLGQNPTVEDVYRIGKISEEDGCYVWNGKRKGGNREENRWGYGIMPHLAGQQIGESRVSRAVMVLHTGNKIPKGMVVMHTCDNPPCVRVEHLVLGTQKDNVYDMSNKKRYSGRYEPLGLKTVTCQYCGERFETKARKHTNKTCSLSCASKLSWLTAPHRKMAKSRAKRACVICGELFEVKSSSKRHTCGNDKCRTTKSWQTRRKLYGSSGTKSA